MDPSLLLGTLLVGVGLALAALAYSLITERAGTEKEADRDTLSDKQAEISPDASISTETVEEAAVEETPGPSAQVEELPSPEGEPETEVQESLAEIEKPQTKIVDQPLSKVQDETPRPDPPKLRPTFRVATLMRDEVTGALVVQVGDEIYRSKEELQSSKDWGRVRFAADDLAKWMVGEPTVVSARQPAAQRTPGGKTERPKEGDVPRSMVEEIDEILQELLVESSHTERAVRLLEGPGGTARVLIGIDSYSIEEVPDPEIKDLIQKAVATWEATR